MALPRVTIIGLGPADASFLTSEALAALGQRSPLYLRTARHPAAEAYATSGAIALDHHYESASTFEDAYRGIVEELVSAAIATGGIGYAVPGSPMVLERTVELLRNDARVEVRLIAGLSFLDLAWERLGVDPVNAGVRFVDAERFASHAAGERGPLLITQTWSRSLLSDIKLAFEEPPDVMVAVLHHLGLPDEVVELVAFSDLDRSIEPDHLTCCYLPEIAAPVAAEIVRVEETVRRLRLECPWDAEQSHVSLLRHLLEETYEAIEAIEDLGDEPSATAIDHLEEELGDVLCQVLFHSVIATEEGWFNLADVARSLDGKLVRRHPHVFGSDASSVDAAAVLSSWESAKRVEKGRTSLLDGIPPALPALALAAKLQRRARGELDRDDAILRGRLKERLAAVIDGDEAGAGAALFDLALLVAANGGEPEEEVRQAATAFTKRFLTAEQAAATAGTTISPEFEKLDGRLHESGTGSDTAL
jgi:tetrapyrrole methylase family protein/MazG family protein